MANEIRISASISSAGSVFAHTRKAISKKFDQSTAGFQADSGEAPASFSNLNTGNLTNEGWLLIKNLSKSGHALLDNNGAEDSVLLRPGDIALFRIDPAQTIRARTQSGELVLLEYVIIED